MLDATERKALVLCVFTASCICFAPAQVVSGIFMLLLSIALYFWDQSLLKRERAAEEAQKKASEDGAAPPSPEVPDAP